MLPTIGLFILLSSAPLDVRLAASGTADIALPVPAHLALHSPLLEAPDRAAQRNPRGRRRNAPAPSGSTTESSTPSTGTAADTENPAGASSETAAPAEPAAAAPAAEAEAGEEAEPSIDLLRAREHSTRMHRPLGFAALGSLVVTEIAGTIMAVNQRTLFGVGQCNVPVTPGPDGNTPNPCILGDYGGTPLAAFHEASAFITVGFYAAAGMYALTMPDPEHASVGNDDRARRLRIHRAFSYVHLAGMILMPILGILAIEPGIVGLRIDPSNVEGSLRTLNDYQATLRTIHTGVGYVTLAALTVAMLYEVAF